MADEPIRVLRVIARLNVGGPALHVSYLTRSSTRSATRRRSSPGRSARAKGRWSTSPRELGVEPVYPAAAAARDLAARTIAAAVRRLARADPRAAAGHPAHPHGEGRGGRTDRRASSPARRGRGGRAHVPRPRAARLLRAGEDRRRSGRSSAGSRASTDALIAVSPEVRDDLVAPRRSRRARRSPSIRLGLDLDGARPQLRRGARELVRRRLGVPADALPHRLARADDRDQAGRRPARRVRATARDGRRRGPRCSSATGRCARRSRLGRVELGIAEPMPLRRLPRRRRRGLRGGRRGRAHVGERGHAGVADRGARRRRAGRRRPTSAASATSCPTGETGFLVPPGDVEAIADRLARLAERRRRSARASAQGGSESVRDRYSVPRLVDDVDALYRELLARRAAHAQRSLTLRSSPSLPPAVRSAHRAARRARCGSSCFSQYFPPEVGATQSRMQSFAEYLAERGHHVTVIAEFPNHPHGVIPPSVPRPRRRGRPLEPVPRPARLGEGERGEDAADAARLLPVVHGARDRGRPARRAGPTSCVATSPPLFTGLAGACARADEPRAVRARRARPLAGGRARPRADLAGWMRVQRDRLERWLYRQASASSP